jgi:hypothetical protein
VCNNVKYKQNKILVHTLESNLCVSVNALCSTRDHSLKVSIRSNRILQGAKPDMERLDKQLHHAQLRENLHDALRCLFGDTATFRDNQVRLRTVPAPETHDSHVRFVPAGGHHELGRRRRYAPLPPHRFRQVPYLRYGTTRFARVPIASLAPSLTPPARPLTSPPAGRTGPWIL